MYHSDSTLAETATFNYIDTIMHIKDKLAEAEKTGKAIFSFEFFPPKTAQVCQFESIERT